MTQLEEGLWVVEETPTATEEQDQDPRAGGDSDLETLRDEFVDGFNARDLEQVLGAVSADVECPDRGVTGSGELAEELTTIWERSPGAILTRAFSDELPAAVAWLPDEDGCWARAALVCLAVEGDLISVVRFPDDPDALDRAEADDPTGEEMEEGAGWAEWDAGEEAQPRPERR